ncbi:MAG: PilZ domain-containing protein [Candidatus Omnitrophica bacterium]|nr:PilZ domain-containing protein [Candidatus Omnitrophota bacterium]
MNITVDLASGHGVERRKYRRIDFREPVQFGSANPVRSGGCLSCDLSEGGLRINVNEFVPPGTGLTLQIPLPAQKIVEYTGRVAWVSKLPFAERYQLGLEFSKDEIFCLARNEVGQFIKRRL